MEFSIHWTENDEKKPIHVVIIDIACFLALKITHNSNCPIFLGFYDNDDVFVADTYTVIHVPEVEPCLNT